MAIILPCLVTPFQIFPYYATCTLYLIINILYLYYATIDVAFANHAALNHQQSNRYIKPIDLLRLVPSSAAVAPPASGDHQPLR